jgi:hypothetical protein
MARASFIRKLRRFVENVGLFVLSLTAIVASGAAAGDACGLHAQPPPLLEFPLTMGVEAITVVSSTAPNQ